MLKNTKKTLLERYRRIMETGVDEWSDEPAVCDPVTYISSEWLDRERRELFRRLPAVVALSADVPTPKSAFSTEIDGVPLVVTRDEEATVHVFVNACRHRGAPVHEGRGTVAKSMVCPYHAWSYRLNGDLHNRPRADGCFAGLAEDGLGLRELPSDEQSGLVLARLEGGGGGLDGAEWLEDIGQELEEYDLRGCQHIDTRTHRWPFNWKMALDTFLEAYHVFILHRDSIASRYDSWPMLFTPHGRHFMTMTPLRELQNQEGNVDVLDWSTIQHIIFPNTLISHQIDHIETWQFFPDGNDPNSCIVRTSIYSAANENPVDEKRHAHLMKNLEVLLSVINGEDFPQCEAIHKAISTQSRPAPFIFGRNEPALAYFHQQLDEALGVRVATPTAEV